MDPRHSHCTSHCCLHVTWKSFFYLLLPLLLLSTAVKGQLPCTNEAGCFPPAGNLALGRTVNATSTCTAGNELLIFGTNTVIVCDPDNTHSSTRINDNNNGTVWVSEIGAADSIITLQLDFEAQILFDQMTMVWGSTRPQSMVLERSGDNGQTWQIYRYYSASCVSSFMLPDTPVISQFNTTDAICTSMESRLNPVTNGLVTFDTSQHLPPGTSVEASLEYRLVTNLRVRFLNQFPDLASDSRLQYYAVAEWIIGGSCMCNGHASSCAPAFGEVVNPEKEVYAGCLCQHNTIGTHCEQCAVGFNSLPWEPGTENEANACLECMCNGHAADCLYNPATMLAECVNCTDNTTGDNCDNCLPGFYLNITTLLNDPNICIGCDCNPAGDQGDGVCSGSGQCNCKANVDPTSPRCDTCQEGYWNLSADNPLGCQLCDCDLTGTQTGNNGLALCDKTSGQCLCQENVNGAQCDRCVDGFFDLANGCQPCACNIAGSESQVCDQNSPVAQCPCRPNIDSSTCTSPLPGFYFRAVDEIRFEAEEATFSESTDIVIPLPSEVAGPFTGRGFISLPVAGSAIFTVEVPEDSQYEIIIRYQAESDIFGVSLEIEPLSVNQLTFDLNCDTNNNALFRFYGPVSLLQDQTFFIFDSVCLSNQTQYEVTVSYLGSETWLLDSLLLFPDFSETSAYYASRVEENPADVNLIEPCLPRSVSTTTDPPCDDIIFALSVELYGQVYACDCNNTGTNDSMPCNPFGGVCRCKDGVGGRQCQYCQNGRFNFSENGCQACACDGTGSTSPVCDVDTGQCNCRDGVGTRTCSECLSSMFNLTLEGCSPCSCSEYALSPECNDTGACSCPPNIDGIKCDQCFQEFYNISRVGCLPCECDPVGSASNMCDVSTGQCDCTGGTVVRDCSQCPNDFFVTNGVDRDRCVECVCSGRSNICTANTDDYALGAIVSDFTELCANNQISCDDGWQLLTADGQAAAPYGPSGAAGLGYVLLDNNSPQLHAPEKFLGNRQLSYGLNFTMNIFIENNGNELNRDSTFISLTGSFLNETLVGTFPYPAVTQDGSSTERLLTYSIPFEEEYWRIGRVDQTATFFQLYSVLADVTELSFTAEFTEDIIEFVYVQDVFLSTAIRANSASNVTIITFPFPVENCVCPEAYSGSSCQECARGHTRPSNNPANDCIGCNCNNLTLDCDVNTGICLNCTGNSEGPNCERCQSGFYGDPVRGIPCLPCECPTSSNTFSPTCFLEGDGLPTCDNCTVGYTGRNCEICMDGFFGNPVIGRCTTCECNGNVDPSLGPTCNRTTGQCLNCLNNTMGFECEQCVPGYFGIPDLNISCSPCQCNPNGTIGDCDSLFGTCTCLGPNVIGNRCDECADGFWGLSQGLGCIPCDCCNNGSLNNICDKDTGRCDCLPNVGSQIDDKCCSCTPGFFDFSVATGCQACNCSVLAVSGDCDIVTGQCDCQVGAIGLKCNDCAFGFMGRVPDCEQCHDCFFQWDDIISNISNEVSNLQARVELLITVNYDGYTIAGIENAVASLLNQLSQANESLNSITLQTSSVVAEKASLTEVNTTIAELVILIDEIEQQLNAAEVMLATTNAFDGSINGTTARTIEDQIIFLNSTLTNLAADVNNSIAVLIQDQILVYDIWLKANSLEDTVNILLANLTAHTNVTQTAATVVSDFQADFESLRSNLTYLDMKSRMLISTLQVLSKTANNISEDLETANNTVDELIAEVQQRREQAQTVVELSQQLNSSILATQLAAQQTFDDAAALRNNSELAVQEAETILDNVNRALSSTDPLSQNLDYIKSLALVVLNISLPSLESAVYIARQINESIIPEEMIQAIVDNATDGRTIAQQALTTAQNASAAVVKVQDVIAKVESDLNCTAINLQQVEGTIPRVEQLIIQTEEDLQEISQTTDNITNAYQEAQRDFDDATNAVQTADGVGIQNRQRANALLLQATQNALLSQQYANNIQQTEEDYAATQASVNAVNDDAVSKLQTAENLRTQAEQLDKTANEVTLQQLNDLLSEYMDERQRVEDLNSMVTMLQQELEELTVSFNQAAEQLQECYRTP